MITKPYSYSLFFDFIDCYLPSGFENINADDPLMLRLEEVMEENNQFFSASDMSQMKFLFTSKGSKQLLGIEPDELDPGFFMNTIHPDDLQQLGLGRARMMKLVHEIYAAKTGSALMSYTLRFKNQHGVYSMFMGQTYFFYSTIPRHAVFVIQVVTNIENMFKKINPHAHWYVGRDVSLFNFPNEDLLEIGTNLSDREFEIVKMIASGMKSQEIAQNLSLSINTVNTHRSNILTKTEKATIADLIYDFKNMGLL